MVNINEMLRIIDRIYIILINHVTSKPESNKEYLELKEKLISVPRSIREQIAMKFRVTRKVSANRFWNRYKF